MDSFDKYCTPSFFRKLQQLKIRTRRNFLGSRQGAHLSSRRGHGLEFSDFKPYSPGDDFRHIDWSVYGRTDRLYIRQFRQEQDLNVMILLDTSASMNYPEEEKKFTMARALALSMGHIALADGDTVTLSFLGQKNTPRFVGPRSLGRIIKELSEVKANSNFNFLEELRSAISKHRIPGKCFIVSDFLLAQHIQFEALDLLRSKNFEIVVFQVLAPSELELSISDNEILVDAETGEELELSLNTASANEYATLLGDHLAALENYCRKAAIPYVLIPSNEDISYLILNKLPELGIVQ